LLALLTAFLIGTGVVVFVSSVSWKIAGFMLMGVAHLKGSISLVSMYELVKPRLKMRAGTVVQTIDTATLLVSCLCYSYVSNNYYGVQVVSFSVSILGLLLTFILPESPKWLLSQSRYEDAAKVMNYIAKLNRSPNRIPPTSIVYDTVP